MLALYLALVYIMGLLWRTAVITARFRDVLWHGREFFENERNGADFRRRLLASGPVFIKLGQWMAQRPDAFPREFLRHLDSLQRDAPAHEWADTVRVLCQSGFTVRSCSGNGADTVRDGGTDTVRNGGTNTVRNGGTNTVRNGGTDTIGDGASEHASNDKPDDRLVFASREPLASGSIAQVYRATFDGRDVVVKVRHPRIAERVSDDLKLVRNFIRAGRLLGNHYCRVVDIEAIMTEMQAQCDLRNERAFLTNMRHNFLDNPVMVLPEPLYANEDMLIETYVDGIDLNDVGSPGIDPFVYANEEECERARHLCRVATLAAFFQQILHDALLHADLHRGNLLYRMERDAVSGSLLVRVGLLDFGIVVHLNDVQKEAIHELMVGLFSVHAETVVQAIAKVARQNNAIDRDRFDAFAVDARDMISRIERQSLSVGGVPVGSVMTDLLSLLYDHRLLIDGNLVRIMVDFILITDGRASRTGDNLTNDTVHWVLFEDEGQFFHLDEQFLDIHAADFNRRGERDGRLVRLDAQRRQTSGFAAISNARIAQIDRLESLADAVHERRTVAAETGCALSDAHRSKMSDKKRRRVVTPERSSPARSSEHEPTGNGSSSVPNTSGARCSTGKISSHDPFSSHSSSPSPVSFSSYASTIVNVHAHETAKQMKGETTASSERAVERSNTNTDTNTNTSTETSDQQSLFQKQLTESTLCSSFAHTPFYFSSSVPSLSFTRESNNVTNGQRCTEEHFSEVII